MQKSILKRLERLEKVVAEKFPAPVPLPEARKRVLAAIAGRKTPFSVLELYSETNLPYEQINQVLEKLAKRGKIKEYD